MATDYVQRIRSTMNPQWDQIDRSAAQRRQTRTQRMSDIWADSSTPQAGSGAAALAHANARAGTATGRDLRAQRPMTTRQAVTGGVAVPDASAPKHRYSDYRAQMQSQMNDDAAARAKVQRQQMREAMERVNAKRIAAGGSPTSVVGKSGAISPTYDRWAANTKRFGTATDSFSPGAGGTYSGGTDITRMRNQIRGELGTAAANEFMQSAQEAMSMDSGLDSRLQQRYEQRIAPIGDAQVAQRPISPMMQDRSRTAIARQTVGAQPAAMSQVGEVSPASLVRQAADDGPIADPGSRARDLYRASIDPTFGADDEQISQYRQSVASDAEAEQAEREENLSRKTMREDYFQDRQLQRAAVGGNPFAQMRLAVMAAQDEAERVRGFEGEQSEADRSAMLRQMRLQMKGEQQRREQEQERIDRGFDIQEAQTDADAALKEAQTRSLLAELDEPESEYEAGFEEAEELGAPRATAHALARRRAIDAGETVERKPWLEMEAPAEEYDDPMEQVSDLMRRITEAAGEDALTGDVVRAAAAEEGVPDWMIEDYLDELLYRSQNSRHHPRVSFYDRIFGNNVSQQQFGREIPALQQALRREVSVPQPKRTTTALWDGPGM